MYVCMYVGTYTERFPQLRGFLWVITTTTVIKAVAVDNVWEFSGVCFRIDLKLSGRRSAYRCSVANLELFYGHMHE